MDEWAKDAKVMALQDSADIAVCYEQVLSSEQRERLSAALRANFPNRRVLVLDGGARIEQLVVDQRLDAIEAKLDMLIAALADEADGEDDDPLMDMDGNIYGINRDDGEVL